LDVRANCAASKVKTANPVRGSTYDACHCNCCDRRHGVACAGQDQQSDGVGAPKATPAGLVDMLNKEINAALADPKPAPAAQGTDANVAGGLQPVTIARGTDTNAVGDPQPVPNTLCARIAARATNFELQCSEERGSGRHRTLAATSIIADARVLNVSVDADIERAFATITRHGLTRLRQTPFSENWPAVTFLRSLCHNSPSSSRQGEPHP